MSNTGGGRPRILIVMRHSKAGPALGDDHARSLTPYGAADAREAGAWLAAQGLTPDYALVSSAQRAQDTWAAVAAGSGARVPAEFDDALYPAGPDTVLEVLRTAPPETRVLLFIGHNPTASLMPHLLDDGEADPEVYERLSEGFPTAALVVAEVAAPWAELGEGSARLTAIHVGRARAR